MQDFFVMLFGIVGLRMRYRPLRVDACTKPCEITGRILKVCRKSWTNASLLRFILRSFQVWILTD